MLLFRESVRMHVGYNFRQWCCTKPRFDARDCDSLGHAVLGDQLVFEEVTQGDDKFFRDVNDDIFYWKSFDEYDRPDNTSIHVKDKLYLNDTGIWYLILLHCDGHYDVSVSGDIAWHNPYGYLSGTIYPFLPVRLVTSLRLWRLFADALVADVHGSRRFLLCQRARLARLLHSLP